MKNMPANIEAKVQQFLEGIYPQGDIAVIGYDSNIGSIVYCVDDIGGVYRRLQYRNSGILAR